MNYIASHLQATTATLIVQSFSICSSVRMSFDHLSLRQQTITEHKTWHGRQEV